MTPAPIADLLGYLADSPSPYHAVAEAETRLVAHGWQRLHLSDAWTDRPAKAYLTVGGALIAWDRTASAVPETGFRIVGAHTDSPNLRIKPRPDTGAVGWRQLGVEVYGGALLNSWLDRDLGVAGRVVTKDGSVSLFKVDDPIARIPQLAIHLDRDISERGLLLDKQQHTTPIWGLGTPQDGEFSTWVGHRLGVAASDIASWDLMLHDLTAPQLIGEKRDLLASARIDNLVSCWCALAALTSHVRIEGELTPLVCLFDHEEVGSESATGAASPLLQPVLERLTGGGFRQALANSACVSADMAHAVHPNYPERHDPNHRPLPNAGPVIKVNSNQRYATDALTRAMFARACDDAGVPHQVFVSKNSMPCGSTIGPIAATRLGIPTVDVGCAQLSMHSARELCGAEDPGMMAAAMAAFFADNRQVV